jgi:nitrite reductase (NO-forming)
MPLPETTPVTGPQTTPETGTETTPETGSEIGPETASVSARSGAMPARRARVRASWHLRANALVVGWLGLSVVAVVAQDALPAPRWLLIHVFLLGAVTTAILIWSEHFTVTLLRARTPDRREVPPGSV